jgi:ubiquinone/menaquinone biosynthesis C-methylase UbiE
MPDTIYLADGQVCIKNIKNNMLCLYVNVSDGDSISKQLFWETTYPLELVKSILAVKGPLYLCDEIMREECSSYIESYLKLTEKAYSCNNSSGNIILDFGCGCGASTIILCRIHNNAKIIGVDLVKEHIAVAKQRAKYLQSNNVDFITIDNFNYDKGRYKEFDYIYLNAVYEHLKTCERKEILPKLWSILKKNGILFVNETPHRYFPIESHTTNLPFINYLPDGLAFKAIRKFSKRGDRNDNWENLLRKGVRGATIREIMHNLSDSKREPVLLKSNKNIVSDSGDVWFKIAIERSDLSVIKRLSVHLLRVLKKATGLPLSPYIFIAIKKT